MKKTKHRRPSAAPSTVDDLLRPHLEDHSTSALIAELTRRGIFRPVPELPVVDGDRG